MISILTSLQERKGGYVAAPSSTGVVIAGILPGSPGEKMGLLSGECIRTVNGIRVSNEKELYDAIQVNAAHCRLQVIGRDGEIRLMQQVIYRHDHHRLGLLIVR
nr:PDZ domain-containing protein [Sporosarcina limicola]